MTHRMPNAARMVSTHASVRRRPLCLALVAAIMGFNSRLREEATGAFSPSVVAVASFNSRLREEATHRMPPFSSMSRSFNSRLREEATISRTQTRSTLWVSTHASVRRRRGCQAKKMRESLVSTHASVRRRRAKSNSTGTPKTFQLTPP